MKQKIKDHLHGESLAKNGNMDVFNRVYDDISEMVEDRVKFEATILNITDEDVIKEIELNASKHYYNKIIDIINVVIDGWKH